MVDTGDFRIGIRTNATRWTEMLREYFGSHVVDDPNAPYNFSVQFGATTDDAHILFRGECPVLRTFDPARLVRALRLQVESQVRTASTTAIEALAMVDAQDRVTLLPAGTIDRLKYAERPLRAKGLRPIDVTRLAVDLDRAEVVLRPVLDVEEKSLRSLMATAPAPRRTEMTPTYGRYSMERWVFFDPPGHEVGLSTPARMLQRAWLSLLDIDAGQHEPALRALSAMCELISVEAMVDPGRRLSTIFTGDDG